MMISQKAPSAIRCIKTSIPSYVDYRGNFRQKAPSAKRCIKTESKLVAQDASVSGSESTERQKVH